MNIGNILKRARTERDVSCDAIAQKMEVSSRVITLLEEDDEYRQYLPPSLLKHYVMGYADALDMDVEVLLPASNAPSHALKDEASSVSFPFVMSIDDEMEDERKSKKKLPYQTRSKLRWIINGGVVVLIIVIILGYYDKVVRTQSTREEVSLKMPFSSENGQHRTEDALLKQQLKENEAMAEQYKILKVPPGLDKDDDS